MSTLVISDAEKHFVLQGVREDLRSDGRSRRALRPLTVAAGVISHVAGSAHVRLANTDILVAVKAELEDEDEPERGRLEFSVDCSANAAPEFEGRGGEELAAQISSALADAYRHEDVFDTRQLSVLAGHTAWTIYADILILECGGNLYDAVSVAVKAALKDARLPRVAATAVDGGQPELELSDDPYDGEELRMENAPVLVTLARVGNYCLVDPSPEEEVCASAAVVAAVTPEGKLASCRKIGEGGFHADTLKEALATASEVGMVVNAELNKTLASIDDSSKDSVWFL